MDIKEALVRAVALLNKCSIPMKDAPYAAQAYELIDYAGKLADQATRPHKEENNDA